MMVLVQIVAEPPASEAAVRTFVCRFEGCPRPAGEAIRVQSWALLSYAAFQNAVLVALGVLYRLDAAEGLPPPLADAVFKDLVARLLADDCHMDIVAEAGGPNVMN